MELINVICHWAMHEDIINLEKPPEWILEYFKYHYPKEQFEFSMDMLCVLGKFQKCPESKAYVPVKNPSKNISIYGLLKNPVVDIRTLGSLD
ncbi:hypothetical protein [Methanococcus sp. CF]